MDTLSETADKVDQSLQNMGMDGTSVKQSIKDYSEFQRISGRAASGIYWILYQSSSVALLSFLWDARSSAGS